ncbi:MAG TPA: DNA cytosine methyltransferase [Verrucomicrobiae bacterium]|nr:DNA cytosine methyltransferase [Verrucomicrobiae bacterium]
MYALDFFCGAGGLTRGLRNVGIQVAAGLDANVGCKRSYEQNNRSSTFIHADLKKIEKKDLVKFSGHIPNNELIFTGCAPCQPFSKQRRKVSRDGSTLLGHFGRLVAEFLPGYVIIENVPGIAKVKGNSTYRKFLRLLASLEYKYVAGRVDAKWFGVPQNRVRWVVIASRHVQPTMPQPTHGEGLKEYETVRQAINHFPQLSAGEESKTVPNHKTAIIEAINLKRLRATPPNGGGRLDWPNELVLKCHRGKYKGHSDVYGRMRWDAPAPTLTCRCLSISNGRYGHPEQHRAISLREAASLQSFPDDYTFYGDSQSEIAAQIGNAVPVKMGEALGRKILELHREFLRAQVEH